MIKKYFGVLCALSMTACSEAVVPIKSKAEFIEIAAQIVEESDAAGVAVAIVKADGSVWSHGFGYADIAAKKPMTDKTVISIGSISKTITGVAVMQLVEKGLIDLDGDINAYLPFKVVNPKQPNHTITPRHVLTHTTGIVDYDEVYNGPAVYYFGGDNPTALGDFLKEYLVPGGKHYSADNNFTDTAPGDRHSYSNVVYGLAGYLVESVSGQSFHEYTRDHILKPLGMFSSGWKYSEIDAQKLGKQYGTAGSPYEKTVGNTLTGGVYNKLQAYKRYSLATYPDGGFRTSASDLSHFLAAIMNGGVYDGVRILKAETLEAMFEPQRFGHDSIPNMWFLKDQGITFRIVDADDLNFESGVAIGHTGGDPGTDTFMRFDPTQKIGVITFINSDLGEVASEKIIPIMFKNADVFFQE